jgi:hypothetical protein
MRIREGPQPYSLQHRPEQPARRISSLEGGSFPFILSLEGLPLRRRVAQAFLPVPLRPPLAQRSLLPNVLQEAKSEQFHVISKPHPASKTLE